ncbi:asparagine synthetase B family protein [Streptosporangium soli]|nr:hypothetical protein [Streptosporangium sp. KLBMP 9127]
MIAFLVRIGEPVAADKQDLDAWVRRYPLLADRPVRRWASEDGRASCHWVSHDEDQLGGVTYTAAAQGAFALFGGRPVRWRNGEADGRDSIDARGYLADPAEWAAELDGRYCVVRADVRAVQVLSDAVGLQPLYRSERDGSVLISNMASLVTPPNAGQGVRPLACLLATGWGMTGEPLAEGVDRIPPGALVTFARDGSHTVKTYGPAYREIFAAKPDYDEAARLMVSLARAFADWPGRPRLLALSGGRDSRVIAAALRRAEVTPSAITVAFSGQMGYPATGDVLLGNRIAGQLGLEHTIRTVGVNAALYSRLPSVLDVLRLTSPGTTALNDIMDIKLEKVHGPLPLMFDGVAGEIARGGFESYLEGDPLRGTTVDEMTDAILGMVVMGNPAPLVNAEAMALLRAWVHEFVSTQVDEGVKLEDVPDALHLHRQATWHGPNVTNREHREDAVSMMLSPKLWPHMLGTPARDRTSGVFHRELLDLLGPELAVFPYQTAAASWIPEQGFQDLSDPIEPILDATRGAVASHSGHAAWAVLDRERVGRLLGTPAQEIRGPARFQLWNLATLFCDAAA